MTDLNEYIREGNDARLSVDADAVAKCAEVVAKALFSGRKVITFGNGGSAADAQHIAAELMGKFNKDRRPLPAMSLTVNTSNITAIGNDYSYDDVFSRQLEGIGNQGDVVIALSTSGNSKNVVKAAEIAKNKGMYVIAFTGGSGGKLKSLADNCILVRSNKTSIIQEAHIMAGHMLCMLVEEIMFP
jgi:D-sedoheptulose 7-phosphate isomerase